MGKFSDPNYKLLEDYFNILVAVRTGTQKSYLLGPNKTVVSEGGIHTILYENNPNRGYVGHRFVIKEIDGNRFKMNYEGLESTFSVASSAFDIGNEMYFRKDSFFHYWLARPNQDDQYHDYANQEKTFLFFGKVWPVSNEVNTYSIEFEGLKDYTLKGIPQHNQTINMEEWLKVYWDQVHHEMYNMTKTFWSMNDAREIDLRWLGYISDIYGIEISEKILNEQSLREWVENLPYFLKRIGTYNALYIIWKVFMQNTSNHLNVYERWGEWCVQDLQQEFANAQDDFVDYHFLESYGTQPSGGAGDYYYSQYDPADYPVHTLEAPSGTCGTYSWDTGITENYLLFSYRDLNCSIGDIHQDYFEVTEYDPLRLTPQIMYLSSPDPVYTGDFTHTTGIEMSSVVIAPSNVVFWALSNEYGQLFDQVGDYLSLSFEVSAGDLRYFKAIESYNGTQTSVKTSYASYAADTPYYLAIKRDGSMLRVFIYDKERRWNDDLVELLNLPLTSVETYSYLYVLNGRRIIGHNKWSGIVHEFSLNSQLVETIAISGSPVITPHYKVQIDLNTEPFGDIFNDDSIITEGVITELVKNWEYVRPVSKYSHYEELVAPLARIDRIGDSVPLYPVTSNGYLNTFFTGSKFISAGGGSGGSGAESTMSHYQQFASKTWTVSHNLASPYLLVQPWIFTGATAAGAKVIQPDSIEMLDSNTVELKFNESVRGVAAIAASGASGITYIETAYESASGSTWNINHNLNSNTPSGYTSPPGPVVWFWKNNFRVMPLINDMLSVGSDSQQISWDHPIEGGAIVRRSDYLHYNYDPEDTWTVEHKLNSWVIVQCYSLGGGQDNREIFPDEINLIDPDTLEIKWNGNTRGYAHVIQVLRDNVVYSPYDCDLLGIGICPEVLGYWKVGTGENTLWNPFIENDLEIPVTSGGYKSITEDDQNVYIDFIVPSDFEDVGIREVGLFNYLDQLVLYSKCSELYKPDGVQTYFHYKIGKLNSSSSSSSSVSSSSSSSSSESSSSSSLSSSSSSSSSSLSSSSSSLSSSSSESVADGALKYIDSTSTSDILRDVWTDGNFVYVACLDDGLRSYSVDGSGNLTAVDQVWYFGNDYEGVWGDGNFVYAACHAAGIISYSVDGSGNLTFIDRDFQDNFYEGVWGDGNFIYCACGGGLKSYSVNASGGLTFIDENAQGGAHENVWGDGTYIYCACGSNGIRSFSVNASGGLTYIDLDKKGSDNYNDVHGDGNFIYIANGAEGIRSYSVDGSGILTYIDVDNQSYGYDSVWSDGTYIYITCNDRIGTYSVNVSGGLTYIDGDIDGNYNGVWGDGNFVYATVFNSSYHPAVNALISYSVK